MKTMLYAARASWAAQFPIWPFLLLALLSCIGHPAATGNPLPTCSPSNIRIVGDCHVPCAGQALRDYSGDWTGAALSGELAAAAEWHWSVEGGSFPGGVTELVQPGGPRPAVQVAWNRFSREGGNLRLELVHGGEPMGAASLHVVMGMLRPKGIAVEGGALSCGGNWFVLDTEVPLNGDAAVEWSVDNGIGMDGQPLYHVVKQGSDAHRLFVEKADHGLPLKVTASARAGCGRASRPMSAEFDYPRTRLTGPETVERGSANSFAVCHLPSGGNGGNGAPAWGSSGTILQHGPSSATVQFAEAGEHVVSVAFVDCKGMPETRTWRVRVVEKGVKGPAPILARAANKEISCRVYPNPASEGSIYVELEDGLDGHLEILNLQGLLLHSQAIGSGRSVVETRGYVPGTYIVRVTSNGGGHAAKLHIR